MSDRADAAAAANALLHTEYDGVLSTLSLELDGYPFGSVMPYALDRSGAPLFQIAGIAQHTRIINADPRVSLIVFERRNDDLQTGARLTLVGDALPVDDADSAATYFRRYPDARAYEDTHDFSFYRLQVRRCRYIGGFGEIYWLRSDLVIRDNPFTPAEVEAMVAHMNADHADAVALYCETLGFPPRGGEVPVVTDIDRDGFDLRLGTRLLRQPFARPCATGKEVREQMVALVRAARGETA